MRWSERGLFSKVPLQNLAKGLFLLPRWFLERFSQRKTIGHEKTDEARNAAV